ncbi:MAG: tetratricopeptide repeat protein [Dysgonamonadaceae bacterium]|nr:tetratricopeptide repeat protein [Dysgonamonadaceae bacterium]
MRTILSFSIFFCSLALSAQMPDYAQWVRRSADYVEAGRVDSAAYALQKAMATDPSNPQNPYLLMNLGLMQQELGLLDDAYLSLSASLLNNPDSLIVLHGRAALLCDMGRYGDAMDDYNRILNGNRADVEAHYRRGLLFLGENDRAKAESDFAAADNINPENVFSRLSRALLYKLDDDWAAAEKIYTDLIRNEKTLVSGYYMNRAECYVNTGQLSKASADLRNVEAYEKENPYYYFLQGRVRLEQYDKLAAKEDFEKAKRLGYDEVIANEWIGKCK